MTTDDDPFLAVRDGARHRALAELAARGPVHHLTLATGADAWVVTGYAEAKAVLTDPRVIREGASNSPYGEEMPAALYSALNSHMLTTDPPAHTRLRRLVSAAFTRRRVEGLAPRIERICADLLDGMAKTLEADGEADLIDAFAGPLPITVICELLGVPSESHAAVRGWAGPLLAGRFVGYEAYSRAAGEFVDFLHLLLADKRRQPVDDLLSALVEVRDGEDRLSEDELTSMVQLLLLAGHETTVNLIANGVKALLADPGQLALLRAEPDRLPAAVEELLRFDSPAQAPVPAITAEPIEVAGQRIPAGENIVIALLAVNRDPARFADPDVLDLTRDDGGHLAFGHGVHHCLGAPLARLEARIALGALLERFGDLALAVPADSLERLPSLIINRLVVLPVRRAG
ncbi:cytochrome P450 [Actinoallomurus bryophytorum]|uniref:Cytochrome P450 n=1 Tax=Actinoallomurus bryophytorum TaxID=1490222 RepID=A0A543CPI2_9ACTN|nr:cytochrome P450 [Actinoallomurus bryophytorum]TQL99003.1 cytochrome P450 [Actinoallomurus bryophytorum]